MHDWWTARLIARDLDVGEQSVYRWIWTGEIPCTRTATNRVRVSDQAYQAFKVARGVSA